MSPMAGEHGEFAGVAMIRAYHSLRGDIAATRALFRRAQAPKTRRLRPPMEGASYGRSPWTTR